MVSMRENEYIAAGLELTRLTVATLGFVDLDQFVDACREQVDDHDDEASRFALDTAEALQRFREELRRLATAQRPHMTAVRS